MTVYRSDFSIMKREAGEKDFTELGLGSTASSSTIQEAGFDAYSSIQNDEWDQT